MSIKSAIKSLLSDSNDTGYQEVEVNGSKVWLSNHDQCHIECSLLKPIYIGSTLVNGINGVPIKEFGREGKKSLYSAYLDECRVAIHQWCKLKSPCSWIRLAYWSHWMVKQGINPIQVINSHVKSI